MVEDRGTVDAIVYFLDLWYTVPVHKIIYHGRRFKREPDIDTVRAYLHEFHANWIQQPCQEPLHEWQEDELSDGKVLWCACRRAWKKDEFRDYCKDALGGL